MQISRRTFVGTSVAAGLCAQWPLATAESSEQPSLVGEFGLATGSFSGHLATSPEQGKLVMLDLPRLMRDRLKMRFYDLTTSVFAWQNPEYVDRLRAQNEQYGCIVTNLKLNQKDVDMTSADEATRRAALDEYRRAIDAAERLKCRWVRPAPRGKGTPAEVDRLVEAYRELIQYSAPRGISLLVENNGWMKDRPDFVPELIERIGAGVAACPDTGNWSDEARYEGLARSFPLAVACDFKAFKFEPDGEHPYYDLHRCFQIGWDAGFRGPWHIEHFADSLEGLLTGFERLRDMLRTWSNA